MKKPKTLFFLGEGYSLYPFFQSGDLFEVRTDRLPRCGDLLAYQRGGKTFIHRYVGRWGRKRWLISSHGKLEAVSDQNLVGTVVAVKRKGSQRFARMSSCGFLAIPVHLAYSLWVRFRSMMKRCSSES